MTFKEQIRKLLRDDLMQVENIIASTYASLLSGRSAYAAIDGGAHTGHHTNLLAKLQGCEKVVAVEADPWTVQKLQARVSRLSESSKQKIEIVQCALQESQERETVSWMSSPSHPGRSGVSSIWQNDKTVTFREKQSVAATTIDKLATAAGLPVAMIKLDLEGGDFMALRGAEATMVRDHPLIVFENSNRAPGIYGFSVPDMLQYFERLGYAPVTFFGELATEATWFDIWEMWAAPKQQADQLCQFLRQTVTEMATPC